MRTRRSRDWSGLEELRGDLKSYLSRRCRDEYEADDIIQETLLRAARYRNGLTDPERLRSWVLRIAANVFRDHVRRECRLPRLGACEQLLLSIEGRERAPGEPPEDAHLSLDGVVMERKAVFARLGGALGLLGRDDRAVLGSFYGGAQSCGVTALECDIPPRLVKVRLFRARRRLQRAVRRLLAREQHAAPLLAAEARRCAGAAVALLVALVTAAPGASPPRAAQPPHAFQGESRPASAVPRLESAAAQLAHARALKLALYGAPDAGREEARRAAVAAYRAVRQHFPEDAPLAAESAFRAGELLRASGAVEAARVELAVACERGEQTPFRARARLELGHIERRAGRFQAALVAYEAVVADADAAPEHRDQASLWAGRAYQDLGRVEDARRVWQRVAQEGTDPLDRVSAYDYLALAAIADGDREGAAGILEACRRALDEVSMEETQLGERVRNALLGMRAVEELKRVIARQAQGG